MLFFLSCCHSASFPARSRSSFLLISVPLLLYPSFLLYLSPSLNIFSPRTPRSLITFEDVISKLSNPSTIHQAPFRASKLTHYLRYASFTSVAILSTMAISYVPLYYTLLVLIYILSSPTPLFIIK